MVTLFAMGLSLFAGTAILHVDVPADSRPTVTMVHRRVLGGMHNSKKDKTTKPEVDTGKQEKPRYTSCWQRKRIAGRWKRTLVC